MSHVVESQEPVFEFLADPATHGGAPVRRIDTHAAVVFLAGERALKVKRAVRFPFLDYSTPEKRKAACEAELEVNRPFAPDIYRRVVAVTRDADGRLALDGRGLAIEWAVDMLRFDEEATLDRLSDQGRIDGTLADALGRLVAAAQESEPVVPAEPWVAALSSYLNQNHAAFRAMPALFAAAEVEKLTQESRDALARLRPLLAERGKKGLVRRGHGDLHLGNIALIDGRPVLFDAIEFDPLIASGNVLYELAFLLMDLAERGLPAPANTAFNRYLAATGRDGDLDGLAALPLFLSLRAAVRAKVTAARLDTAAPPNRDQIAQTARKYFDFASRCIRPAPPRLVAIGGLSGTGKSLLARALAPEIAPAPGAVLLRSDIERKILLGGRETEKLPPQAYEPAVTKKTYAVLADKARRTIAAGHSAIVDAVFAQPAERAAIADVVKGRGVRFHGLFLTADLATRIARVGTRVADASDADAAVARWQESYELGKIDWKQMDAGGTPEQTLAQAGVALR